MIVGASLVTAGAAHADKWKCEGGDIEFKKVYLYAGTGCPKGSLTSDIVADDKVLSIGFGPEYTAKISPWSKSSDSFKSCNIRVLLEFEPGYQTSVAGVTLQGFADLEKDIVAKQTVTTLFFGGLFDPPKTFSTTVKGPTDEGGEAYSVEAFADTSTWSKCEGKAVLGLNTYLNVAKKDSKVWPKGESFATAQTLDAFIEDFPGAWNFFCKKRKCDDHHDDHR
jgi:hypothetical protein